MIELYSKPDCVQCAATKRELTRRGLEYVVFDISTDEAALSRAVDLGHRQAPVVVAGDQNWSGFRPDLIDRLPGQVPTA